MNYDEFEKVGMFYRANILFRLFRDEKMTFSGYCGSIGMDGDIKCTDDFLVNTDSEGSLQWMLDTWKFIDEDRNADIIINLRINKKICLSNRSYDSMNAVRLDAGKEPKETVIQIVE